MTEDLLSFGKHFQELQPVLLVNNTQRTLYFSKTFSESFILGRHLKHLLSISLSLFLDRVSLPPNISPEQQTKGFPIFRRPFRGLLSLGDT